MLVHLLISSALLLSSQTAPTPPTAAAPPAAKEKKICKKLEPVVGTRLGGPRRVCRTQREWTSREEETQRMLRGINDASGAQICAEGKDC